MERYHNRNRSDSAESTRPASNTTRNQQRTRSRDTERPSEGGRPTSGGDDAMDADQDFSAEGSPVELRTQQPLRPKTAHRQRTPPHNHPRYAKSSAPVHGLEKDFPLVRFETEPGRRGILQREQAPDAGADPTATSGAGDPAGRWSSQSGELDDT